MIPKIQGSTQMPTQVQRQETTAVETNKKKSDMNNGPMAANNQQRTAPAPQQHNPSAELKFEEHRMAADLNAKLNTLNDGKPPQTNAIELEDLLVSHLKAPDKTPGGEEGPKPESKAVVGNYDWMISGLKS